MQNILFKISHDHECGLVHTPDVDDSLHCYRN